VPKANRDYWLGKVAKNRARDAESRARLEAAGWRVLVVWECALKDEQALEEMLRAALAPIFQPLAPATAKQRRVAAKAGVSGEEGP
jgi:DNA mismatch endonuclease (patch repair protein)